MISCNIKTNPAATYDMSSAIKAKKASFCFTKLINDFSLHLVSPYRVGLDVSITLEFRTSRTNGVLLAISNQVSDGLGLEIIQGKVPYNICFLSARDLLILAQRLCLTELYLPTSISRAESLLHNILFVLLVQNKNKKSCLVSFSPPSCSSMSTTELDASQQSTCLMVRASVTASGTQSLPTKFATGWS